eukprot:1608286-Rhodomonas_salina.1
MSLLTVWYGPTTLLPAQEPFVVDHIERQRCPTVVVSHLSTLQVPLSLSLSLSLFHSRTCARGVPVLTCAGSREQVLYQYFVGATSKLPFWKLDIPRGSVIQVSAPTDPPRV